MRRTLWRGSQTASSGYQIGWKEKDDQWSRTPLSCSGQPYSEIPLPDVYGMDPQFTPEGMPVQNVLCDISSKNKRRFPKYTDMHSTLR